ncbi:hypothetical protein N9933_01215, partial [bacterium]|nr:hypothetical protein [bacterium]
MKDKLGIRGAIVIIVMGAVMLTFVMRLYGLQVASNVYEGQAERFVRKEKTITPPRGNIFNRYGQIYVSNSPMFDLMITPREFFIPDTSILCKYLYVTPEELKQTFANLKKRSDYSPFKESILARYIEPETYSALQENIWNATGIGFNVTNKRSYNYPVGANFLGYISEVNPKNIAN